MSNVVIYGAAKLAELAHFYFTHDSLHQVVAFTVDREYVPGSHYRGLPVVPFEDVARKYPPDRYQMFVAIGYKKVNKVRSAKYAEAKKKGYQLVSYVNSRADNCFILENQIMQPDVHIGNGVTIWGGCHFGHNTVVEDHCWISPHATICGGVHIGTHSFLGSNVTIRDNLRIGPECIIGAGSVVLNDLPEKQVVVAKPASKYPLDSEHFDAMMDISRNG